jgi:hypothetical protein
LEQQIFRSIGIPAFGTTVGFLVAAIVALVGDGAIGR